MKKLKRILSMLLMAALVFAFPKPAIAAEEGPKGDLPVLTGMFVAPELVTGDNAWDEATWVEVLTQLKDVGMDKVIIQYAVQYYNENYKVFYYTPGFDTTAAGTEARQQQIPAALAAARQTGVKVWLGLHIAEDMWFSSMDRGFSDIGEDGKSAFLTASVEYSSKVFDDLWAQFGEEYGDVIGGWYLPFEYNNTITKEARTRLIENFYAPLTNHIKSVTPNMPTMISPLIYTPLTTPATQASLDNWEALCRETWANSRVDVIAPQDGCGWESTMKENIEPFYQRMDAARQAAQPVRSSKGYGRAIAWNNPECYNMNGTSTMTMKRLTDNMAEVDAYVEEHVSFSLHSLCYAPDKNGLQANARQYYLAYKYLYENGSLYTPATPLPAPQNLTVTVENGFDVVLEWDRVNDDDSEMPVAGYQVWRVEQGADPANAIKIRDVEQAATSQSRVRFTDPQVDAGKNMQYMVYAFDGSGNRSGQPAVADAAISGMGAAPAAVLGNNIAAELEFALGSLGAAPQVAGSTALLSDGNLGRTQEGAYLSVKLPEGESRGQYLLTIKNTTGKQLGFVYLSMLHRPTSEVWLPEKIEVMLGDEQLNVVYPLRDYYRNPMGDVWVPIDLGGAQSGDITLRVTQKYPSAKFGEARVYEAQPGAGRESVAQNLIENQPVMITGYNVGQNFAPDAHFRGTEALILDTVAGTITSEFEMYKGNYASRIPTRGPVAAPMIRWSDDGEGGLVAGRPGDLDRSVWLRTVNLGSPFELAVDMPTASAVGVVSTEWMLDRDATVFLPSYIEYYGMTQNGVQELIGTAWQPSSAQLNFDEPPSATNCHRIETFRFKVVCANDTVYSKIIARVYPQYAANSHFVRGFAVYEGEAEQEA